MNESQKKIIIILCFVLAGFFIIKMMIDSYWIWKHWYDFFLNYELYVTAILIAVGLFIIKSEEK
jgi:hypothetical protein